MSDSDEDLQSERILQVMSAMYSRYPLAIDSAKAVKYGIPKRFLGPTVNQKVGASFHSTNIDHVKFQKELLLNEEKDKPTVFGSSGNNQGEQSRQSEDLNSKQMKRSVEEKDANENEAEKKRMKEEDSSSKVKITSFSYSDDEYYEYDSSECYNSYDTFDVDSDELELYYADSDSDEDIVEYGQ